MKRFFFLFLVLLSMFKINAQTLSVNLRPYTSYFYKQDKYFIKELTITNISPDTLIVWFSDSLKKDNELQNINDYFFKYVGDMSLSGLIYDGNVAEIAIDIGCTFLKELPPANTFTILFGDTCKKNDNYYSHFASNRIVSVRKDSLLPFHFTDTPTWHQLLFNSNTIVLLNQ